MFGASPAAVLPEPVTPAGVQAATTEATQSPATREKVAGLLAFIGIAAALCALVIGAAGTGPWRVVESGPRALSPAEASAFATAVSSLATSEEPTFPQENAPQMPRWLMPVIVTLASMVALALAFVIARAIRRAVAGRQVAADPDDLNLKIGTSAAAGTTVSVSAAHAAAAAALAEFDRQNAAGNPVVAAWLALEAALDTAGVSRRPSQTPTEFTAQALASTAAPRADIEHLRNSYAATRFGEKQLPAAEIASARDSLEHITAALAQAHAGSEIP